MRKDRGITLFIAIIVMGTLLLVAMAVVSLSVRQSFISSAARDSQSAFYAADTGLECALFWDVANPAGVSAFATSTTFDITCNGQDIDNVGGSGVVEDGFAITEFTFDFPPDEFCSIVKVHKRMDESTPSTKIESFGYNTCDTSNSRRVERAVRATY